MKYSKIIHWIGILITICFIIFAVLKFDLRKAFTMMMDANYFLFLPMMGCIYFVWYLRAKKWFYLLSSMKDIKTFSLYRAISIGVFANQVIPGRLGDLVTSYVIKKREKISLSGVMGAVAVERVIDVMFLTFLIILTLLISKPVIVPSYVLEKIKFGGILLGIASVSAGLFLYYLSFEVGFIPNLIKKLIGILPYKFSEKLHSIIESFKNGLSVLQKTNHVLAILGYTFAMWCTLVIYFSLIYPMFSIETSLEKSILTTLFMVLGITIPSAPGAVGSYEAAMVLAMNIYGVEIEHAIGMSILFHLIDFISIVSLGSFFVWKENITLTEIQRAVE